MSSVLSGVSLAMIKTSARLSSELQENVLIFGFKNASIVLFLFIIKTSTEVKSFNFSLIFSPILSKPSSCAEPIFDKTPMVG